MTGMRIRRSSDQPLLGIVAVNGEIAPLDPLDYAETSFEATTTRDIPIIYVTNAATRPEFHGGNGARWRIMPLGSGRYIARPDEVIPDATTAAISLARPGDASMYVTIARASGQLVPARLRQIATDGWRWAWQHGVSRFWASAQRVATVVSRRWQPDPDVAILTCEIATACQVSHVPRNPGAFMCTIARRRLIDQVRRETRVKRGSGVLVVSLRNKEILDKAAEQAMTAVEAAENYEQLLAQLPAKERAVIKFWEQGYTTDIEIARQMHETDRTVRNRWHRIEKILYPEGDPRSS